PVTRTAVAIVIRAVRFMALHTTVKSRRATTFLAGSAWRSIVRERTKSPGFQVKTAFRPKTASALGLLALAAAAGDLGGSGCRGDTPRARAGARPPLPAAEGLPPARRALQVVGGRDRIVDADLARERGLTLVDLSDGWAPAIFADGVAPDGAPLPNRYRAIFTGLAGNRTDGDGQALSPGEQNYLELYGIPATLSVLRERFLADAARDAAGCDPTFDTARLLAVDAI